ncbi:MAG: hypothetical protein R3325_11660 [Thermoanaerobaculia bacterium]|nr:hypothetical protein [Thermoanaerobaculia bacterium]
MDDPRIVAAYITAVASLLVAVVAALAAWRTARRQERLQTSIPELAQLLDLRGHEFRATHRAFLKLATALQEYRDALLPLCDLRADSVLAQPQAAHLRRAADGLLAAFQEQHPNLPATVRKTLHRAKNTVLDRTTRILSGPAWEAKYLSLPREQVELVRTTRADLGEVQSDLLIAKDIHVAQHLYPE